MNVTKQLLYSSMLFMVHEIYCNTGTVSVVFSGQIASQKSIVGQKTQKKLQEEQEKLAKPLQEDEKKIRAKEQELLKKKSELDKDAEEITNNKLLSQDAKQRRFEALQDRVRILEEDKSEFDRLAKRLQADSKRLETKLSQTYQEEMNKLEEKMKKAVERLAEREGWDIVDMKESKFYTSKRIDKTDMVIKELDAMEKGDDTKKLPLNEPSKTESSPLKKAKS